METPLDKARKNPESMKARILMVARRIFGEYGYHATTTRMIAGEVGIDISTLHYHWGDKKDLCEAVLLDVYLDLGQTLKDVERVIHGRPLADRLAIAIDMMVDYFFDHPYIANLTFVRYFDKNRENPFLDFNLPEFAANIARSMNLTKSATAVSPKAMLEVLTVMNAMHGFISGEDYFRALLAMDRKAYISLVKETLKFILIPAFIQREAASKGQRKRVSSKDMNSAPVFAGVTSPE